jgi:RNA polymerase sigma-70 factor (ECF subfamily)
VDEKAFEDAVRRLEPKLYRTAAAILWNDADAADAMQESIIKGWRKLPSLRDDARFDPWITRILINECRNIKRRRKVNVIPLDETMGTAAQVTPADPGLRDALTRLPEMYRLPLLLHHMDGYSLNEISSILHLPVSTLKGRLYEGRKQLKAIMEKDD